MWLSGSEELSQILATHILWALGDSYTVLQRRVYPEIGVRQEERSAEFLILHQQKRLNRHAGLQTAFDKDGLEVLIVVTEIRCLSFLSSSITSSTCR